MGIYKNENPVLKQGTGFSVVPPYFTEKTVSLSEQRSSAFITVANPSSPKVRNFQMEAHRSIQSPLLAPVHSYSGSLLAKQKTY